MCRWLTQMHPTLITNCRIFPNGQIVVNRTNESLAKAEYLLFQLVFAIVAIVVLFNLSAIINEGAV